MKSSIHLGLRYQENLVAYRNTNFEELKTLFVVETFESRTEKSAGNSCLDHLQRFKMLDPDEQFRTICESARFIRPVSVGSYHGTSDDINDGFGNLTASCREYTPPRSRPDSVVKLWRKNLTEIGPVLEVKTFCHLDFNRIEIQVSSTSGYNTNVWVVISRDSNRFVDELRCKDPEYSPGSFEKS